MVGQMKSYVYNLGVYKDFSLESINASNYTEMTDALHKKDNILIHFDFYINLTVSIG